MNGIGPATLAKFAALDERGGWMPAEEFWARFGYRGNRLPWLSSNGYVENFGFNFVGDREGQRFRPSPHMPGREPVVLARVGYRLTEKALELLRGARGGK